MSSDTTPVDLSADRENGPRKVGEPVAGLPGPSRRRVMAGVAASVFLLPALASAADDKAAGASGAGDKPEAASGDDSAKTPVLTARKGRIRLKPEPAGETEVLAFNGNVPGPLLRVRQGEELRFTLVNELEEPVSLTLSGAGAPNALDGVAGLTGAALAPGEKRSVQFRANRPGLFWYRPMLIGQVSRQRERGLYGLLIVDEAEPPQWLREATHDVALVIDDWSLDDDGRINPDSNSVAARSGLGRLGNWLTVNALQPPQVITARPGARIRLRVLNAANARPIPLQFVRMRTHVIGIDGSPSEVFAPLRDQLMAWPGGRFDLIIEAPAQAGAEAQVIAALGDGLPLLTLRAEGEPVGPQQELSPLPAPDLPDAIRLQDALREKLTLGGPAKAGEGKDGDPARVWNINGVAWPDAMGKPLFRVKSGTPVTLEIRNGGDAMQALVLHGNQARRLHNLDDGWEPYWIDVIAVPPGQPTRIAFVAGAPGKWLIGSAIAERLDGGMAAWFDVTP